MPFNGSGTYTLPAADLPVTGTLISSTKMNSVLSDIAAALTASLQKNGESTMSGSLKMGSQRITGLADGTLGAPAIAFANSTTSGVYSPSAGRVALVAAGTKTIESYDSGGPQTDINGSVALGGSCTVAGQFAPNGGISASAEIYGLSGVKVGYRSLPRSTTTTTVATSDVGKCIAISADIGVPNSTFAAGDIVSIYNTGSTSRTIGAVGGITMRLAGTTTTGSRTLAGYGIATLWFNSATEVIVMGTGLT